MSKPLPATCREIIALAYHHVAALIAEVSTEAMIMAITRDPAVKAAQAAMDRAALVPDRVACHKAAQQWYRTIQAALAAQPPQPKKPAEEA